MTLSKKFRRTTLIGGIQFVSVRLTSIVYLMIMARWLSKGDMGIITALGIGIGIVPGSIINWLGWVMQQKSLTTADENLSRNVISELSYYILLIGLTFCPVLAILYLFLMNVHFPSTLGILFLFIVLERVVVRLFLFVEVAHLNLEFRVLTLLIQALLNYIIAVFLYFFVNSIEVILVAWALTETLICLILFYRNKSVFRGPIRVLGIRSVLIFGGPIFFLFLFQTLSITIDRLVIGVFLDQESLAIYHLNYRIANIVYQGILTFTLAISPIIMKLESLNTKRSQLVFIGAFKASLLMILSVFPFLILFPSYVIIIILSEKYIPGASLLSVISVAMAWDVLSAIIIQFRGAKGETKPMLNYALCYFLSQILAYLILFRFGVMGIACSKVLGSIISFFYITISASWVRKIPKIFLGKAIFLTTSMLAILWIVSQFLSVIIALMISIVVILFESAVIKYFTKEELDIIERGVPSKVQSFFVLYRQIERVSFIED